MRQVDHFVVGGPGGPATRKHAIWNPSTGEVQAEVALGDAALLDRAVVSAATRLAIEPIHRRPAHGVENGQGRANRCIGVESRMMMTPIAIGLIFHTGREQGSIAHRPRKTGQLWRTNAQIFRDRPDRQQHTTRHGFGRNLGVPQCLSRAIAPPQGAIGQKVKQATLIMGRCRHSNRGKIAEMSDASSSIV